MSKRFIKMKTAGEKIAGLTAYDATFARILEAAGVDFILVGDSLGMVLQGKKDTLGVRLSEIAYHVRAAAAGAPNTFIIGDMPFGSFQPSPQHAFAGAAKLLAAGADMVKIEGGEEMVDTVNFLTTRGVPVCAHVGLLPQKVRASGGYGVQGRNEENARQIQNDALAMQSAGAALIVLELLPQELAGTISNTLNIPTIGIGSGMHCGGQVLVLYDMLGLATDKKRFVRNFLEEAQSIQAAITNYVTAVKNSTFPTVENSFS